MINKNKKYIVYEHISPSNKRYIGITCQTPEQRWRNGEGYKGSTAFYNAIKKNINGKIFSTIFFILI